MCSYGVCVLTGHKGVSCSEGIECQVKVKTYSVEFVNLCF